MQEYEMSFRVSSVVPFLNYCRENGFEEFAAKIQNRIVYENKNCRHLIARITTEKVNDQNKTVFDCKNVNRQSVNLTISNESMPMELNDETLKIVKSMLDVWEFEVSADNYRTRYNFKKQGIKFEIDDYTRPAMKIVAIEGDENLVKKACDDISARFNDFIEF